MANTSLLVMSILILPTQTVPSYADEETSPRAFDAGQVQWNVSMVGATDAWKSGYSGRDVIVAVIDTGVDINHPLINEVVWRNEQEIPDNGVDDDGNGLCDDYFGWNFVAGGGGASALADESGHGTHVAGIIASSQMYGVAPGSRVMVLKVTDEPKEVDDLHLITAVRYAISKGANIINLSVGNDVGKVKAGMRDEWDKVCDLAEVHGVVVVAAAGNIGSNNPINVGTPEILCPAHQRTVLCVGAVDQDGSRYERSSRGPVIAKDRNGVNRSYPKPDLCAPGVNITSTLPQAQTGPKTGTSMAAPHVSAAAAIIFQIFPAASPEDVRRLLLETARGPSQPNRLGAGCLDIRGVVERLTEQK